MNQLTWVSFSLPYATLGGRESSPTALGHSAAHGAEKLAHSWVSDKTGSLGRKLTDSGLQGAAATRQDTPSWVGLWGAEHVGDRWTEPRARPTASAGLCSHETRSRCTLASGKGVFFLFSKTLDNSLFLTMKRGQGEMSQAETVPAEQGERSHLPEDGPSGREGRRCQEGAVTRWTSHPQA